jgi:hypothetical protein
MGARTAARVLLVASLLVGASCGASIEPIHAAAGCPQQPLRGPVAASEDVPEIRLIDDFETGDGQLERVAGRTGAWIRGTDFSSGSLTTEPATTCVARGKWSGHFAARGFTSWGNNWTAVFNASQGGVAVPYDARAFGGISFWAAFGSETPVEFPVPVGVTTMDNAWNGDICTTCMDYYATTVPLTREWRRYSVRFANMAQAGFGAPLLPMRKDQMVGFIIWPKQQFDIWIDDVRFEP